MEFQSLRLTGFKSFVESTELEIARGLTGIVGPNGCGKSNLIEALRWVMGETSARRMRGGEMDDVIFAGCTGRPARNMAEVALRVLAQQAAGGPFGSGEIEVRRRIDRGEGSDYRVNGRPARARDVQLLFADAAIGADSPAMVSQGRIAALIAARPVDRRFVLEDAAGIAGMQSRRHEAELKLRAAEANLEKLQQVTDGLKGQEANLRKQAKQAEKYRRIAERLREIEALQLHAAWLDARHRLEAAEAGHGLVEQAVRAAMADSAGAAARESEAEAGMPVLRQAEGDAAAKVRRQLGLQQALEAERNTLETTRRDAGREIAQSEADLAHEEQERAQAGAIVERLKAEAETLRGSMPARNKSIADAESHVAALRRALAEADAAHLRESGALATVTAEIGSLTRQVRDAEERWNHVARGLESARAALAALPADTVGESGDMDLDLLRTAVDTANAQARAAHQARVNSETALALTREDADKAQGILTRIDAEMAGLRAAAAEPAARTEQPAIAAVSAAEGFEAALAAALGDDIAASLAQEGAWRWAALGDLALSPPCGTTALTLYAGIPQALRRTLAGVGVASREQAIALHNTLQPGQAIVTPEGGLFRWDGLVREAGQRKQGAILLAQRNRLKALESDRDRALHASDQATAALETARARTRDLSAAESEATACASREATTLRQKESSALAETRARQERALLRARRQSEFDAASSAANEAKAGFDRLKAEAATLPDPSAQQAKLAAAAGAVGKGRAQLGNAAGEADRLRRDGETATAREAAIGRELAEWEERAGRRAQRLAALGARVQEARARLDGLGDRPAAIETELAVVLDALGEAERAQRLASDRLVKAETDLIERRRTARETERVLAEKREARARTEALLVTAKENFAAAQTRIAEKLNVSADALDETVAFEGSAPDSTALDATHAQLLRERDAIGAVNLRAEAEVEEVASEIAKLESERADLETAIASLRQAISKLNREARERLSTAFETVRVHFKRLFVSLFGGGEADLALTNLEDPLEAGLEIYACPPGKKLQVLSLLSGGEQALTSLALLFAMFLATPAPVCVLDEVDAPLDDANVGRFCDLLDEISAETGTRFLVITHHRVTMARMNRLYGVTMAERGVSMLVSVDLSLAEQMAEPAAHVEAAE